MVFTVRAIIEVLGYPESHIKEVVEKVIEKLKEEEGINVLKIQISETQMVKEKFFSCFAELELKINDFTKLLGFCYNYLPSSIEILDTEKINLPVREFSLGLNEVLEKLHNYNILVNNMTNKLKKLEGTKKS